MSEKGSTATSSSSATPCTSSTATTCKTALSFNKDHMFGMHIAVRIKPKTAENKDDGRSYGCTKSLKEWNVERSSVTMNVLSTTKEFAFPFACLPPEATQENVYVTLIPPLIDAFLQGYHVNFLCFGQTGSGKTHTMFGPPQSMGNAAASMKKSGVFQIQDSKRQCLWKNCLDQWHS